MLEAYNIALKAGGNQILEGVEFVARAGEVVAICGPNGAGKSTLLKTLAGQIVPDSGEVRVAGRLLSEWDAADLSRVRALLHQHSALSFPFSVREVVEFGRYPHQPSKETSDIIESCLERVGMSALGERRYTTLSGGEKQRVHLARVLAQLEGDSPAQKCLLLDEPTSALDITNQDAILEVAAQRARDLGDAVVVVLHDLNLAAAWADRVVFLLNGRHVTDGAPEAVMTSETLQSVYGVETHITKHPDTGRPVVLVRRNPQPKALGYYA